MNGYGSIQGSMQGKDVSAKVASCPEEMPQVVGVITSRTRARRGAGDWIEIGRKHRAFVPDGIPVPSVGEVGECWGRMTANGADPVLMVSYDHDDLKPARARRSCWGSSACVVPHHFGSRRYANC